MGVVVALVGRQVDVHRWLLETVVFFVANVISVAHWRGIWTILNVYLLPESPDLSNGLTHVIGIVGLWLMLAGRSVTLSGCFIDGETDPPGDGCLVPNKYVRYFINRVTDRNHHDCCSS